MEEEEEEMMMMMMRRRRKKQKKKTKNIGNDGTGKTRRDMKLTEWETENKTNEC